MGSEKRAAKMNTAEQIFALLVGIPIVVVVLAANVV